MQLRRFPKASRNLIYVICVNCLGLFRSGLVLKLSMALGKGRHSSANMGRIFEVSGRVMDFLPFSNNY